MAAMLFFSIYNLLDSIWLARLGTEAIAAYTITFPFQMGFVALGVGTGVGASSYIARMMGAGEWDQARTASGQVVFLSFTLGLIMIICMTGWPTEIISAFGGSGRTLKLASDYLLIAVLGAPFLFFINMTTNLFRADGRPQEAMYVLVIYAVFGGFLDPLLIFGWGFVPSLGIKGAALAAIISQIIGALMAIRFFSRQGSRIAPQVHHLKPNPRVIHAIYQTGFPTIILNLVFGLITVIYNHTLAPYGPHALGTLSLCFRINGLVMMVLFGIGQGVMPLVGFNLGARLYERLVRIVRSALTFSTLVGVISCSVLLIFAGTILSLATGDAELRGVAKPAIRFFALTLIFAGPTVVWINMFIGLGRGITAMALLFIRDAFILIPSILLFGHLFGLTGVWISQLAANILGFLIIGFWARREVWKIKKGA